MPKRSFDDVKRELLSDTSVAEAVEELAPYEELSRRLIGFRIKNSLSQSELAERCGTTQSAIARLESGEHEPRLETLTKVASALGAKLTLELEFSSKRSERLATFSLKSSSVPRSAAAARATAARSNPRRGPVK